jgi:hydroxyacylglutathione hydrolase
LAGFQTMEIVPGIHKIDGIRIVNSYLVLNREAMLVIDTGWPGNAFKTLEYVRKIGRNPADIKHIILTHADLDHIGCACELKKATGAQLAIHSADLDTLIGKQKFKPWTGIQPFRFAVDLWMRSMSFNPVEPDVILKPGSQIAGWEVVHTPGHTKGSICLYQPGKAIFVGDALRTNAWGKSRPVNRTVSMDHDRAKKSIGEIARLEFEVLLPGHGAPILNHASQKIRDMAARYKINI